MPAKAKGQKPPVQGAHESPPHSPPVEEIPEEDDGAPVSGNVAVTLSRSARRMLQSANVTEKRPELLAMFDFKPLYSRGGDLTLAGKMFRARVSARAQQLESIKDILKDLEDKLPDEFSAAVNQYTSALASVEADIALLKLLILLRLYATHTARFLEFVDEYEIPDNIDLDFLAGSDVKRKITGTLKLSELTGDNFWKTATVPLCQILSDVPLLSYALTPPSLIGYAQQKDRIANSSKGIATHFGMKDRDHLPVWNLAWVTKDFLASYEFVKLREGDEVDETFQELVDEFLDSNFLTSNNDVSFNAFRNMLGNDQWGWLRKNSDTAHFDSMKDKPVKEMLSLKKGILSKMAVAPEHVGKIILPETCSRVFGYHEYNNIDPLVDKAFSGNPPLDFTQFDELIGDFTQSLKKLRTFGNTLFRMADKKDDYGPGPRDFPLVADEMPFTLGSTATAVLEIWNRRYLSVFKAAVYNPYTEYLSSQHLNFVKMIAWQVIKDDYERAYGMVSAFFNDYERGFLTAAGIPEETVIDEETGETVIAATSFVLPRTTTPASLGSVGTYLGSKISTMESFWNSYRSYGPAVVGDTEYLPYPAGKRFDHPGGDSYAIQDSKHDWTCGNLDGNDFRLVNPMYRYYSIEEDGIKNDGKNWLGTKIVAAEIIDCVLEVMRTIMAPIGEPEPVADGDPIFPSLQHSKTPYDAASLWSFCDPAYESFATELWVPTVEFWMDNFTRKTSKTTYFRGVTFKSHAKAILRMLSRLMASTTDNISLCAYTEPEDKWTSNTINSRRYGYMTVTFKCKEDQHFDADLWQHYWSETSTCVTQILESTSWDELDSLVAPRIPIPKLRSYSSREFVNARLQFVHNAAINFVTVAHENDQCLEFVYDFLGSYADRVDGYNAAVQGLVAGEDSALGTFSQQLLDGGDGGVDVLQNITPNQLALKQIALEEDRGDEDNGYVPKLAVLTSTEIKAVKIMAREPNATAPEGDNAKIFFVGIPAGLFDSLEIDFLFGIRVSYVDLEYPQIVFKPKVYPFMKDIYLLPEDLEKSLAGVNSLEDIVKTVRFTKLEVTVEESGSTAASIRIDDNPARYRAIPSTMEEYTNHTVSELLKMYVRIMLGFNFNESAFLGTPEGLQLPINDYAADLAGAMSAGIDSITATSSTLGRRATSLVEEVTTVDSDMFVSGDLEPVDEALLTNLRDAFQTRLFSADLMKTRVMSAKFFDRIFGLVIDPDEFEILAPGDIDACGVTTSQKILDFYLEKGIIEWVGNARTGKYKLAPRKTAEGKMAFGKFFVSITTMPTKPDTAWEK